MNRRYAPLLLAVAIVSAARAEPPALDSVVVDARVAEDGSASVDARYYLEPAGAHELELKSLTFEGRRAANVRAFVGESEVSFRARQTAAGNLDGVVPLPAATERLRLRLTYEVLPLPSAPRDPAVVALPMFVPTWPSREALPRTFTATVALPAGTVAYTGFPSDFKLVRSIDRTSDANVYSFSLPVMPALLRLGTAHGSAPLLTLERGVDLATLSLLGILGVLGWRRLREQLG